MNNDRCLTVPGNLSQQVEELWRRQAHDWPMLCQGITSLTQARTRSFKVGPSQVVAQCNPARITSASAKVDPESLAKRPCFLCEANLPADQKAVHYHNHWLILSNPAPLFEPHFTIATIAHDPQLVSLGFDTMFDMARDFEGAYTVFYNGPKSGASAPDHMHLQAAPAGAMPFETELVQQLADSNRNKNTGWIDWIRAGSTLLGVTRTGHRPAIILTGQSKGQMIAYLNQVMVALVDVHPADPEPMLNLYLLFINDRWIIWLFPRAAHRPSCYGTDPDNFLISPGAVDLGGIVIVPRPADFDRLDEAVVQRIFDEVLFPPDKFAQLRQRLDNQLHI
ncbi:MAG: DUF4922 domain-containing protein [Planctomycetota bacterium]|nr:MAG: DUF4922 domain-containing protein [Planctomycetota bacterium]